MRNVITDAEIVSSLRLVAGYSSLSAAARASGIARSTLQQHVAAAEQRGLTKDSQVYTEEQRLRDALREATNEVKRLVVEADTAEQVRAKYFQLAAAPLEVPTWLDAERKVKVKPEVPVLFVSDIHTNEVVDPVEVAGVNAYNSDISEARLRSLFTTAASLVERDTGSVPVPGIVVFLGGDMVSGDIHEELQDTNDSYTTVALLRLCGILAWGIRLLADRFGRVFVPCVVGNHGRMTKRVRMKGRVHTSFEYLLYCMLEREFKGDDRVAFLIPGEADAYFKINGKRFLLTHGDSLGVKGGDGIIGALGPIMRGTIKVGNSEKQIGRDFDYIAMGHWHYPLYLPQTLVNGAVKGYDEYARLGLRVPYAPASQLLYRVHPDFGLTSRREIILQEPRKATTKSGWVEVFNR